MSNLLFVRVLLVHGWNGYGGQLSGGDGTARFEANWPGSPAGFSLGGVDGTLKLSARNGQLTEVEPGAGRVLGLLVISEESQLSAEAIEAFYETINASNYQPIIKTLLDYKEKNKLNEEREEVCQLSQRVDDSTELKQRAVAIECQILDDIVKQINTNVDDVCSQLFDQDIKIELSLFKTLKVSSKVKQAVTFNMFYKNGVYDDIAESSSGGENDRISISITLALNRLFNHKLILFDETTESLDVELKNRVIQCMTEHGGTCLIIQHEGIEGVFDHVINIDQLK